MTYTMSDQEQHMFTELRRAHLRHPGMVAARVTKLIKQDTFNIEQLSAVRLEFLRLDLPKLKKGQ